MLAQDTDAERLSKVQQACDSAQKYAFEDIKEQTHWCGELICNAAITAQHVFFYQAIGRNPIPDADAYRTYLLGDQNDDGSWGLAPHEGGNISVSCEVYLALKILGESPDSADMFRAREYILQRGGVAKIRMWTRIFFAQFGLFQWESVPELPAELMLMPSYAPISIYTLSSWARATVVPLLLISHHQPVYPLSNGKSTHNDFLDEIWEDPAQKNVPYGHSLWRPWESDLFSVLFTAIDSSLYWLGGLRRFPLRKYARKLCVEWLLSRYEKTGDLSGVVPPMYFAVQALLLEGYEPEDPVIERAVEALERFTVQDPRGKRLQASVSPVWDTAMTIRALCDTSVDKADQRVKDAVDWMKQYQVLGPEGDWHVYNPHLPAGGFCFEYLNTWYPDTDTTAAAMLALLHHDANMVDSAVVHRAALWICGMQNRDGGWAAFDTHNDKTWLDRIPFSDMNALCDPSTPDVTGHMLEALGLLLKLSNGKAGTVNPVHEISRACQKAIHYLSVQQQWFGGWYGRWAANYIFGTFNVLCGLAFFADHDEPARSMMASGARWLCSVQNTDGGWGEGLKSYDDPTLAGKGVSTPSQTAWAVLALLTVYDHEEPAVVAGVTRLLNTQTDTHVSGIGLSWPEDRHTGTGFPGHVYMGYTLYRHYFPMMALGRFVEKVKRAPAARSKGKI